MEERRSGQSHGGRLDSVAPSRPASDVFSDEFEVTDFEPADGFRPSDDRASVRSYTPSEPYSFASSSRIQTAAPHIASDHRMTIIPPTTSRESTRKSMSQQNPFISAEEEDDGDDVDTPLARSPSVTSTNFAPGNTRRSISSASSRQYAANEAHRNGGSGPSHPYTMYPQGTIQRTASTATSAVAGPARGSISSRAGPAHPYGLYTQGVTHSDEEDDGEEDALNPVPVGFGSNQPYRRVRGPEGEEQDIIGEYGHVEQLPPYTRYADDGTTKAPLITEPEPLHSRSPVEGSDPAMPLMHERMSQRQSMTDPSQLEQAAPLLGDTASSPEASTLGKKSWKEKSWQEKKRTKVCGVRFSFCLVLLGIVAIVFAALIGSLVGFAEGSKHKATTSADASSTHYDANLLPTISTTMPSGSYALSLGTPEATQAACLKNPAQQAAWDCNLAGKPAIAISIGFPPVAAPTLGALLFYATGDSNISYGAQYQSMVTQNADFQPDPFQPVQDNDNSTLGPAFYFNQTYNKLVVVPESAFSVNSRKRGWANVQQLKAPIIWSNDWQQKGKLASAGDKPWFCFFNNTFLEGFIYVSKPAVFASSSSSSSTATVTSSMTTTATSATKTSAQYTRPDSGGPEGQGQPTSLPAFFASLSAEHAQTTAPIVARGASSQLANDNAFTQMPGLPYVMKLEERRLPNNPVQAYCQQYQILNDLSSNWVPGADGKPIIVPLEEEDPDYTAYQKMNVPGKDKRDESQACHCQWMHGIGS